MSFVQTYIVIVDGTLYTSSDGGNTYNEKLSYLGYLAQQGSIALYPQGRYTIPVQKNRKNTSPRRA